LVDLVLVNIATIVASSTGAPDGTVNLTPEGAVEGLMVGDRVRTVNGGEPASIVWIGHRTVDCSNQPMSMQVWPVRITAGAFGRGKPPQNLWLSPDHAVYVADVLIPVKHGSTPAASRRFLTVP
jgi:hypothetical protein